MVNDISGSITPDIAASSVNQGVIAASNLTKAILNPSSIRTEELISWIDEAKKGLIIAAKLNDISKDILETYLNNRFVEINKRIELIIAPKLYNKFDNGIQQLKKQVKILKP